MIAPAEQQPVAAVLVDANILIDVVSGNPRWYEWSAAALVDASTRATPVINPLVLAELAAGFTSPEALDAAVPPGLCRREYLPWDAAYLAGQAFLCYRRRGGEAASAASRCPTSTSARTPWSAATPCSRATPRATTPRSQGFS